MILSGMFFDFWTHSGMIFILKLERCSISGCYKSKGLRASSYNKNNTPKRNNDWQSFLCGTTCFCRKRYLA